MKTVRETPAISLSGPAPPRAAAARRRLFLFFAGKSILEWAAIYFRKPFGLSRDARPRWFTSIGAPRMNSAFINKTLARVRGLIEDRAKNCAARSFVSLMILRAFFLG